MLILRGLGSALAVSLLILPGVCNAQSAGGQPKRVFACSFGKKQVQVTAAGGNLIYAFGTSAKLELVVVGNRRLGSVSHHLEQYPRGGTEQLRFRNGPYSYVVFSYFLAGRDGMDYSGLMVFKGKAKLSTMRCKKSREFEPMSNFFGMGFNLDSLPDDPDVITFDEHGEPEVDPNY